MTNSYVFVCSSNTTTSPAARDVFTNVSNKTIIGTSVLNNLNADNKKLTTTADIPSLRPYGK